MSIRIVQTDFSILEWFSRRFYQCNLEAFWMLNKVTYLGPGKVKIGVAIEGECRD